MQVLRNLHRSSYQSKPLDAKPVGRLHNKGCLLASRAVFTSELLAERVVPVPLDGSTVVEGTVCPTAVSSPDDDIRGILAAGL